MSAERLTEQLELVARLNEPDGPGTGIRMLTGIEVDILENGELDQTPEMLDRLDVVVASVHSKLRSDEATMTDADARRHRQSAHQRARPLHRPHGAGLARHPAASPSSTPSAVFAACAENNVAVEINSRPERQDPPDDLIQLALEAGCLFSIDSDAHAPGQLDFLQYGAARARERRAGRADHHHLAAGAAAGLAAVRALKRPSGRRDGAVKCSW